MRWAILDTSVYIDHWERGRYSRALEVARRSFIIRQSAVVLSELRRGARTRVARKLVEELHRLAPEIWAPVEADWWEAGQLVRLVGDAAHWEAAKRREFQNDALIALTARRRGATVVTSNGSDFERLAERIALKLLVVGRKS